MSEIKSGYHSSIWHPFTQAQTDIEPLKIVKAHGCQLVDELGNTYLDANSSWWVNVHGHSHPVIGKAIAEQFQQLDHVLLAGAVHPKALELSDRLIHRLGAPFSKVFFSDDGSTANEVALKMAIQYYHNKGEKRSKIIALQGAYHGDTFGAMSVGERGYFNQPFEPYFFEVEFLPFPVGERAAHGLLQAEQTMQGGEVACIIIEPLVQGSAGMRMYDANWLLNLMTLARKYKVLIIFDEVMTGWGRTGKMFAMDYLEEKPDIVCLSKGLTGGVLPLGLTVTHHEVYNAFLDADKSKALLHGHSFTGSALACAAACANMDLFEEAYTWAAIDKLKDHFKRLSEKWTTHPALSEIRHLGCILALELKDGHSTYFSSLREKIILYYRENGIFLRPLGNVLFFNPPYCITDKEIAHLESVTDAFLESLTFERH